MARTKKKKPPPRVGRKPAKAKKGTPKRKPAKKKAKRRVKVPSKALATRRKKEPRPIRWRYDEDGFPISFYVPLKHQTAAEQRTASRTMVSACSLGAFRQGSSPTRSCGKRGLKTGTRAGRGYAYSRWGYPKGWPRKQFKNPTTFHMGMEVQTYVYDPSGEWGFDIVDPLTGVVAFACRGAESEAQAMECAKALVLTSEATETKTVSNPEPVKAKSFADYGPKTYSLTSDKEVREYIADLRAEISGLQRAAKHERQKAEKMTRTEQMIEYGGDDPAGLLLEDIEDRDVEVLRLTGILTRKREQRQAEREAKKPPKPVVLRRRRGVVTRANPKKKTKNPSVGQLVAAALK